MVEASRPRAPSRAWLLVILLFVGLALAGPTVIAKRQADLRAGSGTASAGSGTASAAGGTPSAARPAAAGTATVGMAGLAFHPGTLTVRKGATVVFDNDDVAPHTVTADKGAVDSGVLDPGKRFSLVVQAGFAYHCAIHSSMTAEIVVAT
jgi:plastocyanin